jgi:GMP synthase-like glutamine amidotransferase
MRVCHLQHVPFEGLGSIQSWLLSQGHKILQTPVFAGEPLPKVSDFDWLIVMGGPMSANDDAVLPWMAPEKRLIGQAIDAGKEVLGVCLGAQLIATVLGAKVYPNPVREIGWFPIQRSADGAGHPFAELFPEHGDVFHWHGDTFDLPAGATRLASSPGCLNQAYAVNEQILALQFHLEMTPPLAANLTEHCAGELSGGPYIQPPAEMLRDPERFAGGNRRMDQVLSTLASRAVDRI